MKKMKVKMPYIPKSIFEMNQSGIGAEEVKGQSAIIKIIGFVIILIVCGVSLFLIRISAGKLSGTSFSEGMSYEILSNSSQMALQKANWYDLKASKIK